MRVLICTQAVDTSDPTLGFFHRWIEEFAAHCEYVTVICLRAGAYELPENVTVLSLGKEKGVGRLRRGMRFFTYVSTYREQYDSVFVHMNPEYVILGGLLWRTWGKKVGLWYVHKSVTWRLRVASWLTHYIFTASAESIRLLSPKVVVVGHGIDTKLFSNVARAGRMGKGLRIITVGRISPTKRLREMLDALDILNERRFPFEFAIVGAPATPAEARYAQDLKVAIATRPYHERVLYRGPLTQAELPGALANADLFLNLSTTGSLDKAVLEAFAAGVPALSSNEAFRPILEPHRLFISGEPEELADSIERFAARTDRGWVAAALERTVVEKHSLKQLVPCILAHYSQTR